jgi:hypothetical protein
MMEYELHIEKVDPEYRWNRVQDLNGDALCRLLSCRDEATFAWFSKPRGGGLRLATTLGSTLNEPQDFRQLHESPLVEIRQYRIAAGQRARFTEFFRDRARPSLNRYDIAVYGPFHDLDDPNNFVWLRGFPNMAERDRRKASFYQSKLWLEEMQDEAFSMIEDYSNVLLVSPV